MQCPLMLLRLIGHQPRLEQAASPPRAAICCEVAPASEGGAGHTAVWQYPELEARLGPLRHRRL